MFHQQYWSLRFLFVLIVWYQHYKCFSPTFTLTIMNNFTTKAEKSVVCVGGNFPFHCPTFGGNYAASLKLWVRCSSSGVFPLFFYYRYRANWSLVTNFFFTFLFVGGNTTCRSPIIRKISCFKGLAKQTSSG